MNRITKEHLFRYFMGKTTVEEGSQIRKALEKDAKLIECFTELAISLEPPEAIRTSPSDKSMSKILDHERKMKGSKS